MEFGEWENLDELDAEELLSELRPVAVKAMKDSLLLFERTIKLKLTGTRTGRSYRVSKTGALHVASAPGEPPARLFGNLVNSVGHSDPEWKGMTLEGEVGPGLGQKPKGGEPDPSKAYARRLEFGGTDSRGVKIEARPYMEPSVQDAEPKMQDLWKRRLGS